MASIVIGALLAIIIPVLGNLRASAKRTAVASNIRQILIGLHAYASDHGQLFPDSKRNGNVDETARLRTLYNEGYITDTKVFINPFNAEGNRRGLGQNIFGGNRDCYFSAAHIVSSTWNGKNNIKTYTRITSDTRIPLVWDQRADNENSSLNRMRTPDGRWGGYFGYMDGTVALIGKPDSVVRGRITAEDYQ